MKLTPEFLSQYEALTRGVGVTVLRGRTIVEVTGSDRVQILQSFTTNDVKRLQPGQGTEVFVTSTQGKTICHIWIFCQSDRHIIDATAGQAQSLIDHFNRYIISEDVTLADRSSEFVDLLVAGAGAETLLSNVAGAVVPRELLDHGRFKISGHDVLICRVEFAGPSSYIISTSQSDATAVSYALEQSGAILCGHDATESARLETGFPLFGLDIKPDNLPQELNRNAKAISFTKGCYLGQETVARIDAIGHVNRLLVGVKFSGSDMPAAGTELFAAGQKIGEVTSAAWSPRLQSPLALALVRRNQAKSGSELDSKHGQAVVVPLPLA
jgi:folate-binding protein YgfZ